MIVVALLAPALGLPLAWRAPTGSQARRWVGWLALADAALWLLVLVVDPTADVGRFGAGAAPVAIGTWLVLASIAWPARRWPLTLAILAGGTCVAGAALLAGGGDLADAAGALAIAAVLVLLAARSEDDRGLAPAAACMAGAAVIALGLVRLEGDTGGFAAGGGALVALGAALAVVGAGARARRTGVVLVPLALLLGVQADASAGIGVALAIGAALTTSRPAVCLGLWALAVATVSPAAALLVAAAAVVGAVWLHPFVALAALPGAAAVVYAATQDTSSSRLALALLAALTIARLWPGERDADDVVDGAPSPSTIAAVAVGAWLVLAPETWGWADAPGLESWGTGILYASGAAALAAFVVASFTDATFVLPKLEVADPPFRPGQPRLAWVGAVGCFVVLVASSGALVAAVLT